MRPTWIALLFLALCVTPAWPACRVEFAVPSDDRWHYPFNFLPGSRPSASCFGSTADPDFDTFNDRDGIFLIAWRTDEQIASGLSITDYEIIGVLVTLTAAAGAGGVGRLPPADWYVDLTVDPWFNMDYPLSDTDLGSPLELFGVGFGPIYSYSNWTEFSTYWGGDHKSFEPRDPFPFEFFNGVPRHVEDNVKEQYTAQPWAIGHPQGYVRPASAPFPVHFDVNLDLSDGQVREYFQGQLSAGRVFVAVTSLYATFKQAPTGFPSFFTKESPDAAAVPPHLTIVLESDGDADDNGRRGLLDHADLRPCLGGPASPPGPAGMLDSGECLCVFDFDDDLDVDLLDFAVFQERFDGGL